MATRLRRWSAMAWRDRMTLAACACALALIHLALATAGYARTRRVIEAVTRRMTLRAATPDEVANAVALARLAAIAGRHGMVEATCLRRSLMLYGWLRLRGLKPVLQLGIREAAGPFQAHAWVELEGTRLMPADNGFKAFVASAQPADI